MIKSRFTSLNTDSEFKKNAKTNLPADNASKDDNWVNKEKTVVSYIRGVKYLGYSFWQVRTLNPSQVKVGDEVQAERADWS